MTKFYDDLVVGEVTDLGSHTFTAQEIKAFAAAFDPQPFHLDEEAARQSHFGALCASGWHTCAIWMRLMIDSVDRIRNDALAKGLPVAERGPSPGFRELKWLKPVYAGDTITYSATLIDKRVSASRPGWGLVTHHNLGVNQKGERVLEFTASAFLERHPA
jgi:acyl dehydratase